MRILKSLSLPSIRRWNVLGFGIVLVVLLSACQASGFSAVLATPEVIQSVSPEKNPGDRQPQATFTPGATLTLPVTLTDAPEATFTVTVAESEDITVDPTPTPTLMEAHRLTAEEWKTWPVIPLVSETAREIYQRGLVLGNDAHAFSILGDCQSLPETFMGVYETDTVLVAGLPENLQAVITNFTGSFSRQSPTVKGGTTAGAILWAAWHENKFTCQESETPLDCELRLHKPSIVIINLGTHYETRNMTYLRKILDQLIAKGIVPILSTKADNRELDERLNLEMAQLAIEYNIPLWNFWAATSDLPNHGVGVKKAEEFLGEIYLSDEGLERHRFTALQALAAVWQAVR